MGEFYDVAPLDGFDPQIGILLSSLQDSTREWRDNLEHPEIQAIVWQPAGNFHSIGSTILHIIDVEAYWFEQFAAGRTREESEIELLLSKETRQDDVHWPTPHSEPIEWYFELHDRIRLRAFEALRGIEPERKYENKHFSCSLRWVVAHVLEHDSYHGGQAVVLHELWKQGAYTSST